MLVTCCASSFSLAECVRLLHVLLFDVFLQLLFFSTRGSSARTAYCSLTSIMMLALEAPSPSASVAHFPFVFFLNCAGDFSIEDFATQGVSLCIMGIMGYFSFAYQDSKVSFLSSSMFSLVVMKSSC